jgi:hypothetical protein
MAPKVVTLRVVTLSLVTLRHVAPCLTRVWIHI